ncbi:MAG TPA: hypothetical protein VNJ46_08665, partial [Gaiellaceae bacterium]|nr:hypothetical protein [Gaiellaceae bacterium]
GKLLSLSGWGSWPPGPRPTQRALYPRRIWQAEAAVFALAVETLGAGALAGSGTLTRAGAAALAGAALLAAAGTGETLRRVLVERARQRRRTAELTGREPARAR